MAGSQIEKTGAPSSNSQSGWVEQITPGELLQFASAPYAIIHAGDGVTQKGFPAAIQLLLKLFHPVPIRMGVLDLGAIKWGASARHLVRLSLEGIHMKPDALGRPPAGFYLFADGVPLAFDPGEFDLNKDGGPLLAGLATSYVGLMLGKKELVSMGPHVVTWNAGERVAEAFKREIDRHRNLPR